MALGRSSARAKSAAKRRSDAAVARSAEGAMDQMADYFENSGMNFIISHLSNDVHALGTRWRTATV